MKKMDFQPLFDHKVSVLIDGLHGKESYTGILIAEPDKNTILLNLNRNSKISGIFIRKDQILSIWVYK